MTQNEYRMQESIKRWNMLAVGLFLALALLAFDYLAANRLLLPLAFADVLILALGIWRLIRLLAYDNITLFLREAFLDVKTVRYAEEGEATIERVPSENSLKRTLAHLFGCPWCLGIWLALLSLFLYFAVPEMRLFFMLLAIAALASLFQMISNLIGWSAEVKKLRAQDLISK